MVTKKGMNREKALASALEEKSAKRKMAGPYTTKKIANLTCDTFGR